MVQTLKFQPRKKNLRRKRLLASNFHELFIRVSLVMEILNWWAKNVELIISDTSILK